MEQPQQQSIQRAIEILGSKQRLCAALWVPPRELDRYLAGEPLPQPLLLQVLEILAGESPRS
jgi:hypothetical protein